jgi:hypothetical protein
MLLGTNMLALIKVLPEVAMVGSNSTCEWNLSHKQAMYRVECIAACGFRRHQVKLLIGSHFHWIFKHLQCGDTVCDRSSGLVAEHIAKRQLHRIHKRLQCCGSNYDGGVSKGACTCWLCAATCI